MRGVKKFAVHPLCLAVGILSAIFGELLVFLAAVLAAIEHECAHAFVAARYGYSLDRIVLMPYGAVVSGDLKGIGRKQELAVLAAGPLANAATAVFFVALWWLYPETYPYTDTAFYVSASLFFVNLLPAWPLDGGRMLAVFLRPLGERRAKTVRTAVSLAVAAGVLGYFVYTCFSEPTFSALAFGLLLAFGAFGGGNYRVVDLKRDFSRGVEEVRIAVSADCTVRGALRFLRQDKYLVLLVFEDDAFLAELPEEEYLKAVEGGAYDRPLKELVAI